MYAACNQFYAASTKKPAGSNFSNPDKEDIFALVLSKPIGDIDKGLRLWMLSEYDNSLAKKLDLRAAESAQ